MMSSKCHKVIVEWIEDDCYDGSAYSVRCGNCDYEFSEIILLEPPEDYSELMHNTSELFPHHNFCNKCGESILWEI